LREFLMKLAAYHDRAGNIVGLALSPSDDAEFPEVVSETHPGLRKTDVKVPAGVAFDFDNPSKIHKQLDKVAQKFRIENDALTTKP
jgi:hypothetical protein